MYAAGISERFEKAEAYRVPMADLNIGLTTFHRHATNLNSSRNIMHRVARMEQLN